MIRKDGTGITQRAWLFMLEHGGRWLTNDLAEEMGRSRASMDRILRNMEGNGTATKYRHKLRKNGAAFGVSPKNRIPQGVTVEDMERVLGIRRVIDSTGKAANDSKRKAA